LEADSRKILSDGRWRAGDVYDADELSEHACARYTRKQHMLSIEPAQRDFQVLAYQALVD
jgi:hypothetical protein